MITYKHNNIKNELDTIYDHIVEGIRIRSKCNWYEHSKNQRFSFSNFQKHILRCTKEFYEPQF